MYVCQRCGDLVKHVPGRGWVHRQGGTYVQRCEACGFQAAYYPSPVRCPICSALHEWRDDHCVMPVMQA